jgi:hypothetical protein
MNAVTSIWRQLVRRRLWPVAVLLLAALAAVPFVLAKEPEVIPPADPIPATSTKADEAIAEPVVAKVEPQDRARRRRVLGAVKDPFQPAPPKKAKASAQAPAPETPSEEDVTTGGGSPADTGGAPVDAEPAPKKTYYSAGTIIVRFGDTTSTELEKFAVKKFGAVPAAEAPLLIYMGLTKDGKKAKFLVDASIEADGDGTCRPHPANCETIELAVGETEFLDVINPEYLEDDATDPDEDTGGGEEQRVLASFQLDLVDIKRAGDDDVK